MAETTSTEILKSTLTSVVRHFLSIVAAYLISKGLVAPEVLSPENLGILALGGATALISLFFIVRKKLQTRNLVETAHLAPASIPMEDVKAKAKAQPLLK